MKTLLTAILRLLALFGAASLHAQSTADSLQRLILSAADDTLKVRRLTELAKTFTTAGDYDSALASAHWGQTLAARLKDTIGLADALFQKGRVCDFWSNYPAAMNFYTSSLQLAETQNYKKGTANALNNIGLVFSVQSQYPQALKYHLESLKINEERGDKEGIATDLNNIGIIYAVQRQYPEALEYNLKSLKMNEERGDKQGIGTSLNNIGNIYIAQNQYPQALDFFLRSLNIAEELGNQEGISLNLVSIGNAYMHQNQYERALKYFEKCLGMSKELQMFDGVYASALYGIASVYTKQRLFSQALPKAINALKIRKELGERTETSETFALLSTIYAALGNYNAAYDMQTQHHTLKDSLFNADNDKKISRLQSDYEAEKQAAEKKLRDTEARHKAEFAAQERERVTQLQYAAIAGVVLFVLALALVSRRVSTEIAWWQRFGRFVSFAAVVMLVEFAILFLDVWLDNVTGGAPLWRMAANVCIAVVVTPVHGLMETRLRTTSGQKIIINKT